jgi:hypothetical protein
MPVIDRLVLLGAEINHERNSQGQVIHIERHYQTLIAQRQMSKSFNANLESYHADQAITTTPISD